MIPFLNISSYKNSYQNLNGYVDKLNKQQLTVEDILEEEELVLDIKQNSNTEFMSFITNTILRKLIDYATRPPLQDTKSIGYKYPYNACELLSSDNTAIIDRLMNEIQIHEDQFFQYYVEGKRPTNIKKKKSNIITYEDDNQDDTNIKSDQHSVLVYNNLDYLFAFFDIINGLDEDAVVLMGYFSQIFIHLIEAKGELIIQYVFTVRRDVLRKLLDLINYNSICDCILHILIFNDEDSVIPLQEYKTEYLNKILEKLHEPCEKTYSSICDLLCSSTSNKLIHTLLIRDEECIKIVSELVVIATPNPKYLQSIIKVIIKMNGVILQAFKKKVTQDYSKITQVDASTFIGSGLGIKYETLAIKKTESLMNDIKTEGNLELILKTMRKNGLIYISYLCDEPKDILPLSNEQTTYNQPQERLGMTRLILMKYIRTLIDIMINCYANNFQIEQLDQLIQYLCDKQLFKKTIEFFFKFEFNNIYQTIFLELMAIVTNEYSPKKLIDDYFIKNDFLNQIISFLENRIQFEYNSKRMTFSGCFASVIQLSHKIFESKNKWLKKIMMNNKDFCVLYDILIVETKKEYNTININNGQPQNARLDIINQIDSEEKQFSFSRYSYNETLTEELKLFKMYKEAKEYRIKLAELRMTKVLKEVHNDINDRINEEDIVDMSPATFDLCLNIPEKDDIIISHTVLPITNSLNVKTETNDLNKGSKEINNYYDNSYWNYQATNNGSQDTSFLKDL